MKNQEQPKNTIANALSDNQLEKINKMTAEQQRVNRKRAGQLFAKLERTLRLRRIKFIMDDKKIAKVYVDGVEYIPMMFNNNIQLFKSEESESKFKNFIDAETFFPGIND